MELTVPIRVTVRQVTHWLSHRFVTLGLVPVSVRQAGPVPVVM